MVVKIIEPRELDQEVVVLSESEEGGDYRENLNRFDRFFAAMERETLFSPVRKQKSAMKRWRDYDIALLAENDFDEVLDPLNLNERVRKKWIRVLYEERWGDPLKFWDWSQHYYLIQNGIEAGIVGIQDGICWGNSVYVFSLYVHLQYRGQGLADQALQIIYRNALKGGFPSIHLKTLWNWQRPLRYYLRKRHMWGSQQGDIITLKQSSRLPRYSIRCWKGQQEFWIKRPQSWKKLFSAEYSGQEWKWRETPLTTELVVCDQKDLLKSCSETFALHLAISQ